MLLALAISAVVAHIAPHAASRATDDLGEMLRMATAVAEVEVLSRSVQSGATAGIPLTVASMRVVKVYKGDLKPGELITVECFGGSDGTQQVFVSGQPDFAPGGRSILLLWKPAASAANFRVLGGDSGQIVLASDGGRTIARRASGEFDYCVRDQNSALVTHRSSLLSADAAGELLRALLETGTPVLETGLELPPSVIAHASQHNHNHATVACQAAEPTGIPLPLRLLIAVALTTAAWLALRRK